MDRTCRVARGASSRCVRGVWRGANPILAASALVCGGIAYGADVVVTAPKRTVESFYQLPPVWGGTITQLLLETTEFGPWSAEAIDKALATQQSTLPALWGPKSPIEGTFAVKADLIPPSNPQFTQENATSSLTGTLTVTAPVACHASGQYWLQRFDSAVATVTIKLVSAAGEIVLVDEAAPSPSGVINEGTFDKVVLLPEGTYTFSMVGLAKATTATVLTGGVAEADFAATLTLGPADDAILDVPGEFATIGAALAAAADFQTIRLAEGVYTERIALGSKKVSVIAAEGASEVVIDGGNTPGSLLTMSGGQGAETLIRGLTFRNASNGSPLPSSAVTAGGGMQLVNASPRIEACRFESNHADRGGGLYSQFGVTKLVGCTFVDNSALKGGAIAYLADNATDFLSLTDTTVVCNAASDVNGGGAVWVATQQSPQLKLINATVCSNTLPQLVATNLSADAQSTLCACLGDLDGDGGITPTDLAILLGDWGATGAAAADINCDGAVGASDLAILLGGWGPCN